MEESKLLDRVRKLLAKAEDPGVTDQEAEIYNQKAATLIAQYGIDQALLAGAGEIRDEVTRNVIGIDNPYGRDKGDLLNDIAQALRCRAVFHWHGRSLARVTVVGFRSDLERVEVLYTSLLLQATNHLTRVRPDNGDWGYENTRSYRISWMRGFRTAVYRRLVAAENRAADESLRTESGSGNELVLADRSARVNQAYVEAFPKLGKVRRRNFTGSGYGDGHTVGQRADLGTTGLDGTRRRSIRED